MKNLIEVELENLEVPATIGMTVMGMCDADIKQCNQYDHNYAISVAAVAIKRGEVYATAKVELGSGHKVAGHYAVSKSSVNEYIRIYNNKDTVIANADTFVDMSKRKLLQLIAPPKQEKVDSSDVQPKKKNKVDSSDVQCPIGYAVNTVADYLEDAIKTAGSAKALSEATGLKTDVISRMRKIPENIKIVWDYMEDIKNMTEVREVS